MTDKAVQNVAKAPGIHLNASLNGAVIDAFLHGLFASWEKGRQPQTRENGAAFATCEQAAYAEILQSTAGFILGVSKNTLEGSVHAIGTAYFTDGFKAGVGFSAKLLKSQPAKLPAMAPRALDTDMLVKSIGEEIRKAFEAGQASGKGNASGTPPRVASAMQTVQRDQNTGEIVATVVNYQYDEAPGVQPPPL